MMTKSISVFDSDARRSIVEDIPNCLSEIHTQVSKCNNAEPIELVHDRIEVSDVILDVLRLDDKVTSASLVKLVKYHNNSGYGFIYSPTSHTLYLFKREVDGNLVGGCVWHSLVSTESIQLINNSVKYTN